MNKNLVLKSQANEVYEVIREDGFDVSEFVWRERDGTMVADVRVSELVHRSSGYYFIFDWHDRGLPGSRLVQWAEFSPGEDAVVEQQFPGSWDGQLGYLGKWLLYLRRELEAPDLWNSITQQAAVIGAVSDTETPNTPFTPDERKYIADSLEDISHQITAECRLSEYQAGQLEAQVAYLVDSTERSGRRDWTLMALGVVVNVMLMGTIPPDAGRQMFHLLSQVFQQLLGEGRALLQ
jgi:hypothetical protein